MNGFNAVIVNSPIRWAGSKKKILNEMLNTFPKNKKNYIEMFLGSGVVLLNVLDNNKKVLKYKNFYVNDINSNIINFYISLRDNIDDVIIKTNDFELKISLNDNYDEVDFDNSIILYESLKELPLYILTDERFWAWINFEKGYKAAIQAMPIKSNSTFSDHWLFT